MEAPEKIYLIRNFTTSTSLNTTNDYRGKYLQEWYKSREKDADVEYIRTDVVIEKAEKWLSLNMKMLMNVLDVEYDTHDTDVKDFIADFKRYMSENISHTWDYENWANNASKQYRQYRELHGIKDPITLDEIEEAYYEGIEALKKHMEG